MLRGFSSRCFQLRLLLLRTTEWKTTCGASVAAEVAGESGREKREFRGCVAEAPRTNSERIIMVMKNACT